MIWRVLVFLLLLVVIPPVSAEESLRPYLWKNRVLLVFAPDLTHSSLSEQSSILHSDPAGLEERHMVDSEPTPHQRQEATPPLQGRP